MPQKTADATMKRMLHLDVVQSICEALLPHHLCQSKPVFRPGKQTLDRNAASPHCNQIILVILETFIAM
jgi:hypothetical protein